MPWLETDPVIERKRFILEAEGGLFSFAELCRRHGISRKTGYKWAAHYEAAGDELGAAVAVPDPGSHVRYDRPVRRHGRNTRPARGIVSSLKFPIVVTRKTFQS